MVTITYILAAVILLGLCIFVHELGHLLGGRMVGIKAEVFSIGYGKGIIKKKWGDTTYQLTLIPFGGYCKFYGEDPSDDREGKEYEFLSAHPLKRVVTVVMGPLFNLFFGVFLFFIMNISGYSVETNRIYIPEYFKSGEYVSPAYQAGLKTGDIITEINNETVSSFSDVQSKVVFSDGKPLSIQYQRGDLQQTAKVTPKKYSEKGYYTVGVMPYGKRVLIANVLDGYPAEQAGLEKLDEIQSVEGKQFETPQEFTEYIRKKAGTPLEFTVIRSGNEKKVQVTPQQREVLKIEKFTDTRFPGETYEIALDKLDLIKSSINDGNVKINGKRIQSFSQFVLIVKRSGNRVLTIKTPGGTYKGNVTFEKYGFVGIETAIAPEMVNIEYGFAGSVTKALIDPFEFIALNVQGIGMMFSGELDVRRNLSGPIRIAKIAGDTAYYRGVEAFILLMAKISIILMVMNLLPIPMVDGSYIVFFLYEAIKGRPLNEKIMEKIQLIGFAFLIMLGVFIIFNDLSFLPFFQKFFN